MLRIFIVGLFAGALFLSASGAVSAKGPNAKANKANLPPPKEVNFTGDVASVGGGVMVVNATKGKKGATTKTWNVALAPDAKVSISATAELNFLKVGQFVEFSAPLDQDKVQGELSEITIVEQKGHRPRIGDSKSGDDKSTLVVVPDLTAGPQKVKIVGRLSAINDHTLTVTAQTQSLEVTLSAVPFIKVQLSDPSLVKAGGKATVHGFTIPSKPANGNNRVRADKIDVVLSEPLAGKTRPSASAKLPPIKVVDDDAAGDDDARSKNSASKASDPTADAEAAEAR